MNKTNVVIIDGQIGVGKSFLIKRLREMGHEAYEESPLVQEAALKLRFCDPSRRAELLDDLEQTVLTCCNEFVDKLKPMQTRVFTERFPLCGKPFINIADASDRFKRFYTRRFDETEQKFFSRFNLEKVVLLWSEKDRLESNLGKRKEVIPHEYQEALKEAQLDYYTFLGKVQLICVENDDYKAVVDLILKNI